jgi:hypothetical protein
MNILYSLVPLGDRSLKFMYATFTTCAPNEQKARGISTTNINRLILFGGMIALSSKNHE